MPSRPCIDSRMPYLIDKIIRTERTLKRLSQIVVTDDSLLEKKNAVLTALSKEIFQDKYELSLLRAKEKANA